MALRKILTEPDETLRKKSRPVDKFDSRLGVLLDDMKDTLYDADGVGLAAPQVGILRRVVVIDIYDGKGIREFINPEIFDEEGSVIENEGCLSVPTLRGNVARPEKLKVRAQDRYGNPFTLEAEGLLARAICHEVDHLNGILFTDRAEKGSLEKIEDIRARKRADDEERGEPRQRRD